MKWCLLDFNSITEQTDIQGKWKALADNTGNLVFMNSLKKILDVTPLSWHDADINAEHFDGLITTSLIWITEGDSLESTEWLLNHYKDKPIVPISIGLQAPDLDYEFKLNNNAVKILHEMEERAVLGVRGEYTAKILNKHGIKNIQVIGCPSIFYNLDGFMIERKNVKKIKAVSSIYSATNNFFYNAPYEIDFLNYIVDNGFTLIKQTQCDDDIISKRSLHFAEEKIFFDAGEWMRYVKDFNFSFGARFHGNVMSLISGVPALFIEVDSRTSEMCRFFRFPTIRLENFKANLSVKKYYEMADYTEFNSVYTERLRNLREFCKKNKINFIGG